MSPLPQRQYLDITSRCVKSWGTRENLRSICLFNVPRSYPGSIGASYWKVLIAVETAHRLI